MISKINYPDSNEEKRIKIQHLKGQPYEPADVAFIIFKIDISEDNKRILFDDKSQYRIEILDEDWFYSP